jgi:tRNA dimethylallyltransferase
LEVLELTGIPLSRWQEKGPYCRPQFSWCKLGLYLEREPLYRRIEERIDDMLAEGLLKEVRALLSRGYSPGLRALDSIGYREMLVHIRGQVDFEEAVSQLKKNTRQYAKRQMTWFCKEGDIFWFHARNEGEQFLLAIRKLWAGQFPEAKELEKRRDRLQRSWSLKPFARRPDLF